MLGHGAAAMNIPWKVSEQESTQLGAQVTPLPTAFTTFGPIDVRGWDWVEFSVGITNNIGGTPSTQLDALVEYGESSGALAGVFFPLTSEDVDPTGLALQADWAPQRVVAGATVVWRLPVPVHGQQMQLKIKGNATPDATSTLDVYAYRRSF
jgi:hypothetical protein